jgi:hypothetical protein
MYVDAPRAPGIIFAFIRVEGLIHWFISKGRGMNPSCQSIDSQLIDN